MEGKESKFKQEFNNTHYWYLKNICTSIEGLYGNNEDNIVLSILNENEGKDFLKGKRKDVEDYILKSIDNSSSIVSNLNN